ncbi:MAG: DUF2837 family protein [Bacteroidia bacterium]
MNNVLVLYLLFFLINFFGTLSYAARMVGVRTKMLALSFSLFNIINIISRTANGFQTPFLAKYMESNFLAGVYNNPLPFFRSLLLISTAGCVAGTFFIPTTQRLFTQGVLYYNENRSLRKTILKYFKKSSLKETRICFKTPSIKNFNHLTTLKGLPIKLFIYHCLGTAFISIGVLSCIYAGFLEPQYRTTASSLSFMVNGIAMVILFIFIDPPLSAITDDSINGKITEPFFRKHLVWFLMARIMGTILAQIILIPIAKIIAQIALIM